MFTNKILKIKNNYNNIYRGFNDTRFIVSHYWDTNEPNLLFCEAKSIEKSEKKPLKLSLYTSASKQKRNKMIGSSVYLILLSLLIVFNLSNY